MSEQGAVNGHLGTTSKSLPDLVQQLGAMRFGHAPRVADVSPVADRFRLRRPASGVTQLLQI
jgi:hypothetical protein